jgi:hypothetical protein
LPTNLLKSLFANASDPGELAAVPWPFKININPPLNGCLVKIWHIQMYSTLFLFCFGDLLVNTRLTHFRAAVH